MDKKEISRARQEAKSLFRENKKYLQGIEKLDPLQINEYFSDITELQLKTIAYLLFFITKKEIPIAKHSLSKIRASHFKGMLKYFNNDKFPLLLQNKDALLKVLDYYKAVLPELVKPLFHRY